MFPQPRGVPTVPGRSEGGRRRRRRKKNTLLEIIIDLSSFFPATNFLPRPKQKSLKSPPRTLSHSRVSHDNSSGNCSLPVPPATPEGRDVTERGGGSRNFTHTLSLSIHTHTHTPREKAIKSNHVGSRESYILIDYVL